MGNRLHAEECIGCGEDLVFPFNEYRACSKCTEKIKEVIYKTKMQSEKKRGFAIVNPHLLVSNRKLGVDA